MISRQNKRGIRKHEVNYGGYTVYTLSANYLLYIININILYSIYEYCSKVHCTVKSDGEKKEENNFKPKSV